MGRVRKTSKVLEMSQVRAGSIKSISPTLDLGNGLTAVAFDTAIASLQTKLADYNQALAAADEKANALALAEKEVRDLSERMLAGVAARFGKNSSEYEQAGGVRKSERKPPTRKAKTPPDKP
jgi:hypothetical protein